MAAKRTQRQVAVEREQGGDPGEEQRIKLPKTDEHYHWDDGEVGGKILPRYYGNAEIALEYQKKPDYDLGQQTVADLINSTDQLKLHTEVFYLYPGFKKGLIDLLLLIKEKNSEDCPILLLHGIPGVGKSALARCLAYYLSIDSDNAAYISIKYKTMKPADAATISISNYFLNASNRWTIFDQCNLNSIDQKLFLKYADVNADMGAESPRKPIILFTAGHYSIPEHWYDHIDIDFRVIDLKVDNTVVQRLKGNKREGVDTEDLLTVTNVFGRVLDILSKKGSGKAVKKVTTDDMLNVVYEVDKFVDVIIGNRQKFELLWLLLPQLAQAKIADVEESGSNPEAWPIEPEVVYCLGHILSLNGDPQQQEMRSIMNWLCVTRKRSEGEPRDSLEDESSEFCTYKPNEYFYYFPQVNRLHEVLNKDYNQSSPTSRYITFYQTYQALNAMATSKTEGFRGNAFERLIAIGCEIKGVGILVNTSQAKPKQTHRVDHTQKVLAKDVEDLCKDLDDIRKKGAEEVIWCELNVPGKKPFKGYDFAYVEVSDSQYQRFDVLQATVNTESHSKTRMLAVLMEVEKTLGTKVQPYFLVPKGDESEDVVVENQLIPVASVDVDPSTFLFISN